MHQHVEARAQLCPQPFANQIPLPLEIRARGGDIRDRQVVPAHVSGLNLRPHVGGGSGAGAV
jgi:hypothetical protein